MHATKETKRLSTGEEVEFWRVASDIYGNPRFVVHYLTLVPDGLAGEVRYLQTVKAANRLGGRKYTARWFGGGVVFTAYACQMAELIEGIRADLAKEVQA